jgi:hypothetical protein
MAILQSKAERGRATLHQSLTNIEAIYDRVIRSRESYIGDLTDLRAALANHKLMPDVIATARSRQSAMRARYDELDTERALTTTQHHPTHFLQQRYNDRPAPALAPNTGEQTPNLAQAHIPPRAHRTPTQAEQQQQQQCRAPVAREPARAADKGVSFAGNPAWEHAPGAARRRQPVFPGEWNAWGSADGSESETETETGLKGCTRTHPPAIRRGRVVDVAVLKGRVCIKGGRKRVSEAR